MGRCCQLSFEYVKTRICEDNVKKSPKIARQQRLGNWMKMLCWESKT